jgi:hypothetical protein
MHAGAVIPTFRFERDNELGEPDKQSENKTSQMAIADILGQK